MVSKICPVFPLLLITISVVAHESNAATGGVYSLHFKSGGDVDSMERSMFEIPSSFEFYNSLCNERCHGNQSKLPFLNACPQCPGRYESAHCNKCCQGGASSLKMRWHGCPSTLTFSPAEKLLEDCGQKTTFPSFPRFVECECYDTLLDPNHFDAFGCVVYDTMKIPADAQFFDICIVSTKFASFGSQIDPGILAIDLTTPLPSILGLINEIGESMEGDKPWLESFATYFDTACSIDKFSPNILPIFPGYAKFPNTCHDVGFIDLQQGNPALPDSIDHLRGRPPAEAHWFEFMDGTSTSFWPTSNEDKNAMFNPSFAVCACSKCPEEESSPQSSVSLTPTRGDLPTAPSLSTAGPLVRQSRSPLNRPSKHLSTQAPSMPVSSVIEATRAPSSEPTIRRQPGPIMRTALPSNYESKQSNIPSAVTPNPTRRNSRTLVPLVSLSRHPELPSWTNSLSEHPSLHHLGELPSQSPSGQIGTTIVPSAEPTLRRRPGPIVRTTQPSNQSVQPSTIDTERPTTVLPNRDISMIPTNEMTENPSMENTDSVAPSRISTLIPSHVVTSDPTKHSTYSPSALSTSTLIMSVTPTNIESDVPSTVNPTTTPTRYPTRLPTALPSDVISLIPTSAESDFPSSLVPTTMPTRYPTQYPTALPSLTMSVIPTSTESDVPSTVNPSTTPTIHPTQSPTELPSVIMSVIPTNDESDVPSTVNPTTTPTRYPTRLPTALPSVVMSVSPTSAESDFPSSLVPTTMPTRYPTQYPTALPSLTMSVIPTSTESDVPSTVNPTTTPTIHPTQSPTEPPSVIMSVIPTNDESDVPSTVNPTTTPTRYPTRLPTELPSVVMSVSPTSAESDFPSSLVPTTMPTRYPTQYPTALPSLTMSVIPTSTESDVPSTVNPSTTPTIHPTQSPTELPSVIMSVIPTNDESDVPSTVNPTTTPTRYPTRLPTELPSIVMSVSPTGVESDVPSPLVATIIPAKDPTQFPTVESDIPSIFSVTTQPTSYPNRQKSALPSLAMSTIPSIVESDTPSTVNPLQTRTKEPTQDLTAQPSLAAKAESYVPSNVIPTMTPTIYDVPTNTRDPVPLLRETSSESPSELIDVTSTTSPSSEPTRKRRPVPGRHTSVPSTHTSTVLSQSTSHTPSVDTANSQGTVSPTDAEVTNLQSQSPSDWTPPSSNKSPRPTIRRIPEPNRATLEPSLEFNAPFGHFPAESPFHPIAPSAMSSNGPKTKSAAPVQPNLSTPLPHNPAVPSHSIRSPSPTSDHFPSIKPTFTFNMSTEPPSERETKPTPTPLTRAPSTTGVPSTPDNCKPEDIRRCNDLALKECRAVGNGSGGECRYKADHGNGRSLPLERGDVISGRGLSKNELIDRIAWHKERLSTLRLKKW